MDGIYLSIDDGDKYLDLTIKPEEIEGRLDAKTLLKYIRDGEFGNFFIFEDSVAQAVSTFKNKAKLDSTDDIFERIGERRDAVAKFRLAEGDMSATLTLTAPYAGKNTTLANLLSMAKHAGIIKGLSRKRLQKMLEELESFEPGDVAEDIVAKGLPPKNGKNSRIVPLVPNALERILRPQEKDGSKVDMRNLGDIICVKAGTAVAKRLPPTEGRDGFTVAGTPVDAMPGQWASFKPGAGTVISEDDENLLVSEINGMPKFQDEKMWVDDTFISKGVNVGTGNINYDGAVLVNGDVTENMKIVASGDVTINGFVESATIQAGGDIIITEGAMGKVNDANTEFGSSLIAQGNVHVAHGQGLDIMCNGNVTVGRQLAYSRIVCRGSVIVGPPDRPNGNLFACTIESQDSVKAGTLGAVSGSTLSIDFSAGLNLLMEKKDQLDELLEQIQNNHRRHENKISFIKSKKIPAAMATKAQEAVSLYNNEKYMLEWLEEKVRILKESRDKYTEEIGLLATQRLYPGVVVRLNNRSWKAEREYPRAKIHFFEHQWQYAPMT